MADGKRSEAVDVVVVGAGLSGLTAARRSVERGLSVVVLEANARVGGRTLTQNVGDTPIDLGGQWLGPNQPRMLRLAEELKIETYRQYDEGLKILDINGKRKTHKTTIPPLPPHELLAVQYSLSDGNRLYPQVPLGNPALAEKAADWDGMTLETWKKKHLPFAAGRGLFDVAVQVVFGAEAAEISLLYFLFYLHSGGGLMSLVEIEGGAQQMRVKGGTQQISEKLAAMLGERVHLSSPVREIEQTERGVIVHTDVASFAARRAIVAVPPPMAGRIRYSPQVPFHRDQMTQRVPMGATIKCIALYEKPFWRDQGLSGEAVSPGGPCAVTFDNTSPSADGSRTHASMLGFIVGKAARDWGARPAADRKAAVLAQYVRHFGDAAGRPIGYIEKDWSEEPFIRGCPVANFTPGSLGLFGGAIREPFGRVHFAGTETATEWHGYMEGAVQAGERAAEEVAALEGTTATAARS